MWSVMNVVFMNVVCHDRVRNYQVCYECGQGSSINDVTP